MQSKNISADHTLPWFGDPCFRPVRKKRRTRWQCPRVLCYPPSPLYQRCVRIGGAVPMQKKRRFCVDGFAAADTTLRWGGAGGGRRWRSLNTTGDVFFARDGPGVPILGCGIIRYINESTFASDHGHCLHTSQSVPSNKPHLIIQAAHPPCGSEVLRWCVKFLRGGVMSGLNGFW